MSIDTLLVRHKLWAKAQGQSNTSIEHVRLGTRLFNDFLGGVTDVRKVEADDLRRFILALQQRDKWPGLQQHKSERLSATSVNTYVRGVKRFWLFLELDGIITKNLLKNVPTPPPDDKLPKIYSEKELQAVFAVIEDSLRDRAVIMLYLDTGIRLSELESLMPEDADLDDDTIKVFGKGRKERLAFFSPETAAAINRYCHFTRPEPIEENCLFLTNDGRPLSNRRIQKDLERIGKKAGLNQRLSPHKLRHSYATHSLRHGANLEYVRLTMGHKNIKTTEKYLHLANADIAQAHQKFSPVTNLGVGHGVIRSHSQRVLPDESIRKRRIREQLDKALELEAKQAKKRHTIARIPGNPRLKELGPKIDKAFGPRIK